MTARILWITNLPIGEGPGLMGLPASVFGGWLQGLFEQVASSGMVDISVAFPVIGNAAKTSIDGEHARYYGFPSGPSGRQPSPRTSERLREILDTAQPDLVHVFGTEFQHSATIMRLCYERNVPTLVQMQGLMGSIVQHYFGWLPERVTRRVTLIERLRGQTLQHQRSTFQAAGEMERQALELADHVLGRTTYDRAWVSQINPNAQYHHVEENLRNAFYEGEWCVRDCDRYSLMISQGTTPYKGVHIAIAAMPEILKSFPDATLSITGPDPIGGSSPRDLAKRTTYGWYLSRLLSDLGIRDRVHFTGSLQEEAMRTRYLASHAFLSCSSIENSSNALSEAQILGLPVVASYVGGTPDLIKHGRTGFLYQGDAPYMLAHLVKSIFSDDGLATQLGGAAREDALERHDRSNNANKVLSIYRAILDEEGMVWDW